MKLLTEEEIRAIISAKPEALAGERVVIAEEQALNLAHTALVALRALEDYTDENCCNPARYIREGDCYHEGCLSCHLQQAEREIGEVAADDRD